jgi:signal transduction histidine kinase/ActR/RegA family two-component response regulator/HAMP domain-containing protein
VIRHRSIRLTPNSFASQLLLLFALALLVPVAFIGTLIRSDIETAEQSARGVAVRQARRAAAAVESAYTRDQELATILGGLPEFWNGQDEDRDQILTAFSRPYPSLNGLKYFTEDFEQHGAANAELGGTRPSMAIRTYAQEAVATGQPAFADEIVSGRTASTQLLSLVIPLREPMLTGRFGYLAAAFRTDQLPSMWDLKSLPDSGSVLLVDTRSGRVLGGTLNSPFVPNTVVDESILEMVHSESSSFRLTDADGDWLFTRDLVDGTPWVVFVRMPMSSVLDPIYTMALQRGLLLLAMANLMGILLLRFWRQMGLRLGGLQRAAAQLSRGNWAYRTTLRGTDEFDSLHAAFNAMAQQIEDLFTRERDTQRQIERERASRAAVMASMSDGLLVHDENGRIIHANRRASQLLGIEPEMLEGKLGHEAMRVMLSRIRDAETAMPAIQQAGAAVARGQRSSFEMTVAGPPQVDLHVQLFPFSVDQTGGIGVLLHDITAERELVRAKDELVSMVSHELASPATNLTTYADLLASQDYDPAERREMLVTMVEEGKRMTAIVRDFLDVQRLEHGRLSVAPRPTSLRTLIEHSARIAEQDTDHAVILDLSEDLPCVQADPDRVQQVLANLLSNARKYTPAGGEIRLSARRVPGAVEVAIADDGLGIPPEALPKLFEKFYRVDGDDRRGIRGTGLGLAIVKQIVVAQGGRLGAESAGRGQGSRFWFTLPLAESDEAVAKVPLMLVGSVPARPAGMRVLAVDDDPAIGNVVRRVLRSGGHVVTAVTSAEEALLHLRAEPFDVVISDLGLGSGLDGWQLAAEVRRAWPSVRFVMTSGKSGIDVYEARLCGVDDLLDKPYRPEDLQRVVARAADPKLGRAA